MTPSPKTESAVLTDEQLPSLPKVGPVCYGMADDILQYKIPRVGVHTPGVYDVALYTADQMRDYARAALSTTVRTVLTDEQIDEFTGDPDIRGAGGVFRFWSHGAVLAAIRAAVTALSTSRKASGEAVPEEWRMFACNVADECGDTPVPNVCAERLEKKALQLLESIGELKTSTPPSPQPATTPSAAQKQCPSGLDCPKRLLCVDCSTTLEFTATLSTEPEKFSERLAALHQNPEFKERMTTEALADKSELSAALAATKQPAGEVQQAVAWQGRKYYHDPGDEGWGDWFEIRGGDLEFWRRAVEEGDKDREIRALYPSPPPAAPAVPTLWQIMGVAKALHAASGSTEEWDALRQCEIDVLRSRAEAALAAAPQQPKESGA